MPQQTFEITAPNGKTLEVSGDHVPTESELHDIFAKVGVESGAKEPDTYAGGFAKSALDTMKRAGAGVLAGLNPIEAVKGAASAVMHPVDTATGIASALAHPVNTVKALSDPETGGKTIGGLLLGGAASRVVPLAAKIPIRGPATAVLDSASVLLDNPVAGIADPRLAHAGRALGKISDIIRPATAPTTPQIVETAQQALSRMSQERQSVVPATPTPKPIVQAAGEVHTAAIAAKVKLTLAEFQEASKLVQQGMSKEKALESITAQRAFLEKFKGLPSTQAAADEVAARP